MPTLAAKSCIPCRGGVPPLDEKTASALLAKLDRGWTVEPLHHLTKTFAFAGFMDALDFVKSVAAVAEAEGHHPDLHLAWGRVGAEIWTHKINGLTESDFILAAKMDEVYKTRPTD